MEGGIYTSGITYYDGEVIPMLTRGTCGVVSYQALVVLMRLMPTGWLKDLCTDGDVRQIELARAVGSGCSRAVRSDH